MGSLTKWLYLTAFVLVAYWVHAGYRSLVAKGKQAQFRLEQRRRAGIPDNDPRPFDIAQAEAAQARRRKALASKASGTPLNSARSSPQVVKTSATPSPFPRLGGITSSASSSALPVPSPGQSSRYDPKTYINSQEGYIRSPQSPSLSNLKSRYRPNVRTSDPSSRATSTPEDNLTPSREQIAAATRGRKRGASEARNADEEDSIIATKYEDRKRHQLTNQQSNSDASTIDEEMEEDQLPLDLDTVQRGSKRSLDELSVSRFDDDGASDDEGEHGGDEDENLVVPVQRRRVKLPHRPAKRSKAISIKGAASANRSVQDDMHDLHEEEETTTTSDVEMDSGDQDDASSPVSDADDSMRSISSRRRDEDISDSERELGQEWTDRKNGLQWRIDLEDVMSEEETSAGRKRRVLVKKRVKRRLTVRREMKPKWDMPLDSLHPDAGELIPHYVPVWLTEEEFQDAQIKGQLGSQAGQQTSSSSGDSNVSSPLKPSASSRNLDVLFHQPSNSLPLRSSPLASSSSRQSPLRVSRSTTPLNNSLSTPSKNKSSRLSLSINNSADYSSNQSSGNNSPSIKPRILDSASKRKREEELMRKLKESNQRQESSSPAPSGTKSAASVSFDLPAASTTSNNSSGITASQPPASSGFSFGTPSANAPEGKKEEQKADDKTAAPAKPISFGPPSTESASTETAKPFSFGAPSSASNTSQPQPQSQPQQQPQSQSQSFSFGTPSPAPSSTPAQSKPSTPSFAFNAPSTSNASSSSSASTSTPAAAPAPSFKFGSQPAASSSSSQPQQSNSTPSFTFAGGAAKPAAAPASSNTTPFSFGTPPAAASASKPSFTFGSPATSTSSTGGSAAGGGGGFSFSFGKQ
ncbi:unnamed protein product [Sympodiomycopsis kandeliae]